MGPPPAGVATATSPAASTSGADVRQYSSTSTPRSQAMPASRARASLACMPTPSTTASASRRLPSASSATQPPSGRACTARRLAFKRNETPCAACNAARWAETPGGTLRAHRRGACSSTVVAQPARRAVAATSRPIQPPPAMTMRRPGPRRARRRKASSRVRSTWTAGPSAPGKAGTMGRPPVHRISLS